MLKNAIQQAFDSMDPNEAAQQLAEAAQRLFSVLARKRSGISWQSSSKGKAATKRWDSCTTDWPPAWTKVSIQQ